MIKMKKKRLIIGSLLAVVIIFLLFRQIDFKKLANFEIKINFYLLAGAFFLSVFSNLIRAKRFNYILNNSLKLTDAFRITSFYNFYTSLFPGGLGEVSFIYLIRKKIKPHIPTGLSSVMVTRVYDVLMMSVFLLGSLVMFSRGIINKEKYIFLAGAGVIIAFLIIRYLDKAIEKINKVFCYLARNNPVWLSKVKNNLELTTIFLRNNKKKNVALFFITLLFWGINFLVVQLFFWSFGLKINYLESILLGTISNMIVMIPLSTFAGFGYLEGGFTLGLILIGLAKEQAVIYSFIFHLVLIGFTLGLVVIGVLLGINFPRLKNLKTSKEF
jgi:uncharacterized protein (TIRG00374 family)